MTDLSVKNQSLTLSASVDGPSAAANVLCLHGISNSRDTWQETVAHLHDRYRVWTLDFRGHGHSDRSRDYLVQDYVSDASAMLALINQPTVVIGHSLGGIVAAVLAQAPHPLVTAVLLEDPPLYLNEEAEWRKTVLSKAFPVLREQQTQMQNANASLHAFIEFAANSPSVLGGVVGDHQTQRHLDSNGSALQRHDPSSWEPALDMTMLASVDSAAPLQVPCLVLQADHALGPALLASHEQRFLRSNPSARVITYQGAPHRIHATANQEARFLREVDDFLAEHARV